MSEGLDFSFTNENNNRAVLLLHGLTGHPYEMKFFGKELNKKGFDVFCPVLPGHCKGINEVRNFTWQEWLDFTVQQYDILKQKYDEVFVSGLCLGAVLSCALGAERKDISGICGLSTTLFLDGWEIPWFKFLLPILINTIIRYFYLFPERSSYGIKNERISRQIALTAKDNSSLLDCVPMVSFYELLNLAKHTMKNSKNIEAPIILFHSKEDNLTSTKSSEFIYKNTSSKIKDIVLLEDCYHVITLDNKKKQVAQKAAEFFNNVSKYSTNYDIKE